jgi:hypothetical protein
MSLKTVIAGIAAIAILAATALMPTDASAQFGGRGMVGHPGGLPAMGVHPGPGPGIGIHPGLGPGMGIRPGPGPGPAMGFHPGRFYPGIGRGRYRGYGGWLGIGVYPSWGYGLYPWPYSYGPSCGYVHVRYYRHHRAYWHWVYTCQ